MSASTRTLQQPLGFGQIGAALAVVALAIIVAAVVAFGSMGAAKTDRLAGCRRAASGGHRSRLEPGRHEHRTCRWRTARGHRSRLEPGRHQPGRSV